MNELILRDDTSLNGVFDLLDVSLETRKEYKNRIYLFLDFIKDNPLNLNSFLEFKRALAEKNNYSISTKNKYLITAKILLKELNKRGLIGTDITQNIKCFNQSKKHKKEGINEDEMSLLIFKLNTLDNNPSNIRTKAILSLLALQGLRQIEIIRLDLKDLDLANNLAFVKGKGQDDKESIDLQPSTVKIIKEYLKITKIADGALFVSTSNNSRNKRLTTRSLREIVKHVLNDLSIDKCTHGFRHYFTTKLIKTFKGNLLEVAKFTRHNSLEMLQVYNDNIERKESLPAFYNAFGGVTMI